MLEMVHHGSDLVNTLNEVTPNLKWLLSRWKKIVAKIVVKIVVKIGCHMIVVNIVNIFVLPHSLFLHILGDEASLVSKVWQLGF